MILVVILVLLILTFFAGRQGQIISYTIGNVVYLLFAAGLLMLVATMPGFWGAGVVAILVAMGFVWIVRSEEFALDGQTSSFAEYFGWSDPKKARESALILASMAGTFLVAGAEFLVIVQFPRIANSPNTIGMLLGGPLVLTPGTVIAVELLRRRRQHREEERKRTLRVASTSRFGPDTGITQVSTPVRQTAVRPNISRLDCDHIPPQVAERIVVLSHEDTGWYRTLTEATKAERRRAVYVPHAMQAGDVAWEQCLTRACRAWGVDPLLGLNAKERAVLLALTDAVSVVRSDEQRRAIMRLASVSLPARPGVPDSGSTEPLIVPEGGDIWRLTTAGRVYLAYCWDLKEGGERWFQDETFTLPSTSC